MTRFALVVAASAVLAACSAESGSDAPAPSELAGVSFPVAGLTGQVEAGRVVFARCRSCHAVEPGAKRVGPTLHAVVGRPMGSVEGFRYSGAMQGGGKVWTEDQLFAFLEAPRQVTPGTTMTFAGIKDPQQRADVIAYLKTLS